MEKQINPADQGLMSLGSAEQGIFGSRLEKMCLRVSDQVKLKPACSECGKFMWSKFYLLYFPDSK